MNGFNKWIREVINPQAGSGNGISMNDFTRDGMREFLYPMTFVVNGITFRWSFGSRKTRGKGMSSHFELWLHANDWNFHKRIATGDWTLAKTRKGLREVYESLVVCKNSKERSQPNETQV